MDTLRGNFADHTDGFDEPEGYDSAEEQIGREAPPSAIGQDERRMQVRAYNHWASLLEDKNFPSIDTLEPDELNDFGPYSVLLDFTSGTEDPGVSYLGAELAEECGARENIRHLSEIPSRSLLSRITDHYMQILANQAPIGFEAEFVNQRGCTILYRGILLPFSSDDDAIDFIYGVINWKEMADQVTTDELLLEIDQALEAMPEIAQPRNTGEPLTNWADGPASDSYAPGIDGPSIDGIAELSVRLPDGMDPESPEMPNPRFGSASELSPDMTAQALTAQSLDAASLAKNDMAEAASGEITPMIVMPEVDESDMALGDWLNQARELANAARSSEDRTRNALYDAIDRAYDFALAADNAPEEFNELIADSGLTIQQRAPMTPVVKLVFGADYDKTRLTEYASALSHGRRLGLARGQLGDYLKQAEGGLKGVIKAERRLRREESGKVVQQDSTALERLAEQLRNIKPQAFDTVTSQGTEFALVMIRRTPDGDVLMLGEVPEDGTLVERAAKKLLG